MLVLWGVHAQKWWNFRFWSCEFTRIFGARNLWFSKILSQSRKNYWMKTNTQKKSLEMKVMGMEGYKPMPPGRKNRFPCKLLSTATITTNKELLKASFPGGIPLDYHYDQTSDQTIPSPMPDSIFASETPNRKKSISSWMMQTFRSLLPSTSEVKFMKLTFLWHRFLSNKVMLS